MKRLVTSLFLTVAAPSYAQTCLPLEVVAKALMTGLACLSAVGDAWQAAAKPKGQGS